MFNKILKKNKHTIAACINCLLFIIHWSTSLKDDCNCHFNKVMEINEMVSSIQ